MTIITRFSTFYDLSCEKFSENIVQLNYWHTAISLPTFNTLLKINECSIDTKENTNNKNLSFCFRMQDIGYLLYRIIQKDKNLDLFSIFKFNNKISHSLFMGKFKINLDKSNIHLYKMYIDHSTKYLLTFNIPYLYSLLKLQEFKECLKIR